MEEGNGVNEAVSAPIKAAVWKEEVLFKMLPYCGVKQFFKFSQVLCFIVVLLYISVQLSIALSLPSTDYSTSTMLSEDLTNSSTETNVYLVKAVVYEIGVLTDYDSTPDNTTEREEEVKISFYKPPDTNNGP